MLCDNLFTKAAVPSTVDLFTVGGNGIGSSAHAVSLAGSLPMECPQVQDFPYDVSYVTAATLNGAPVVCGGKPALREILPWHC